MTSTAKNHQSAGAKKSPTKAGKQNIAAATTGSIADWAADIDKAAEKPVKKPVKAKKASTKGARTARGTSIGGKATAKQRAAAGLNPVAGLDVGLEDASKISTGGATATVEALSNLIASGNPLTNRLRSKTL